tara:strand:+ start:120 stop:629 length:510 start_codon:yes stop_codon:yes gene_type:complete
MEISARGRSHIGSTFCWGDSYPISDERTKKIWQYWCDKKKCQTPLKQWLLSGAELVQLFEDAGISADDIGVKSQQYQLGRHNDSGHYQVGNCRFITTRENLQERTFTPEAVQKIKDAQTRKPVRTPSGWYESLTKCSEELGIRKDTLRLRLRSNSASWSQWQYAEEVEK